MTPEEYDAIRQANQSWLEGVYRESGFDPRIADHQYSNYRTDTEEPDWGAIAGQFWGEQPHPQAPGIKIKDYETAARLATATKFGGHASPTEIGAFWPQFQQLDMAPDHYLETLQHAAQVSFAYHGRPPSMVEMSKFKDMKPAEIRKHYEDLPDRNYPDVPAGQMVKYLRIASQHARQHIDRGPVKLEAALFHHQGLSASGVADYYKGISTKKEEKGGLPDQGGGVGQGGGLQPPGQRQPLQQPEVSGVGRPS